jgi:hypothetical protein
MSFARKPESSNLDRKVFPFKYLKGKGQTVLSVSAHGLIK